MMTQKSSDIEVLDSWIAVEFKAAELQDAGWDIRTSFLPLYGQKGYLCQDLPQTCQTYHRVKENRL